MASDLYPAFLWFAMVRTTVRLSKETEDALKKLRSKNPTGFSSGNVKSM